MAATERAKPKLLALGDGGAPTGFARVMHALLEVFSEHYEVHQIGLNYRGDPHPHPWKIYPAANGGDVYGVGRVAELVEQIQPDVIFAVNDAWILNQMLAELSKGCGDAQIVVYTPVDGGPLDPRFVETFHIADHVVAYTQFGEQTVRDAMEHVRRLAPAPWRMPALATLPHGVDTQAFCPLDQNADGKTVLNATGISDPRLAAKRAMLPELEDPDSSFIVLNANRNQPRKRIDLTMDAFARFARGKPNNVLLYLHMGLEDAGWNIPRLAEQLGIDDRLVISSRSPTIPALPDSHLNLIYNACDVGLNTSTGEGWGLVAFEHAAARGAQVMTAHDTAEELWRDAALLVPHSHIGFNPHVSTEAKIADAGDIAAALQELYEDRARLRQLQDAAFRRATSSELQWPSIAAKFMNLFEHRSVVRETGT